MESLGQKKISGNVFRVVKLVLSPVHTVLEMSDNMSGDNLTVTTDKVYYTWTCCVIIENLKKTSTTKKTCT